LLLSNPFIRKLEHANTLLDSDRVRLQSVALPTRKIAAREDVIREGDNPENVNLVLEGIACRYKYLPNGRRAIVAFLLPGDFCDLHVAILGSMDHAIGALTPCTIAEIPRTTIDDLTDNWPRIARALWWATLVDEGILREWLVNLGQRPSDRKLAHLFCELQARLQIVGLASENEFPLPLTQEELGDTLGLSTVHVNRVLQQMREDGLIRLQGRTANIPDLARLKEFGEFNPNYLHLQRRDGAHHAHGAAGVLVPSLRRR
jgi:CRP-like cAMP-binding protein